MKKIFALILVALFTFCMFAACTSVDQSTEEAQTSESGQQEEEVTSENARDTIVMAIDTNPTTMHPFKQYSGSDMLINQTIYDPLLFYAKGATEPTYMLAEAVDIDESGTVYTFTLRQGVKFHNGNDFTAEDVVYSFELMVELSAYNKSWSSKVVDIEATDDYTVVMTLDTPFAPFLHYFENFYICDKDYMEEAGEDFETPIGTGPYMFVSASSNDQYTFKAFEDYWGGAPSIENVIYKVITEPSTNVMALQTGEIDCTYSMPASSYAEIEADSNFTLTPVPVNCLEMAFFNTDVAPFDNVLVRQAISYAVDRELLSDVLYEGMGTVATTFITPSATGYSAATTGLEYNLEKAKELMAEAGYADGIDTAYTIMAANAKTQTMAEIVQQAMSNIGFTNVSVEVVETAAFNQRLSSGEYQCGTVASGPATTDASACSTYFLADSTKNYANVVDEEILDWFEQAEKSTDSEERLELYAKIDQKIIDQAYYCPLGYRVSIFAYNSSELEDIGQASCWSRSGYPLPQFFAWK